MCALQYTDGDRNNPYTFDDYLFVRNQFNFYKDDEFFQELVRKYTGSEFEKIDKELKELSDKVTYEWSKLADEANRLENRAKCTVIQHFDAHNHRIDRIKRASETETLERGIFGLGLWDSERNTAWSRFCKMFLLEQLGECGVMCPMACTHGAIELAAKYEDELDHEAKQILMHMRDAKGEYSKGDYALGSQFVSEIQGGSDVPANLVEAVYEEEEGLDGVSNCWRIYGKKFFCSAMQADYAVVSAKPKNTASSTKVAAFLVPAWLPGNKEKEIRNSYTIDRLKPKMGTAELPTAEVTYNGAVAYPIGPLENGLSDIVGVVLSLSRLHVAFGLASGGLRVAREAILYTQFRDAFGVPISSFPLLKNQIEELNRSSKAAAAGAFKVYSEYIQFGEKLISGIRELQNVSDLEERKRRFRLRELIMLQKIVVANDAPRLVRLGISFFGGHGIMEDFLSLPRFHRDAMIQELWEGPRNVLLTQIHRDLQRVSEWYSADDFVRDILEGVESNIVEPLAESFKNIIDHDSLLRSDNETLSICREWSLLSDEIFHTYQNLALREVYFKDRPMKFNRLLKKFKKENRSN